jgi:hypothetical protein
MHCKVYQMDTHKSWGFHGDFVGILWGFHGEIGRYVVDSPPETL